MIKVKSLITYIKKLLNSDWLRAVQLKCNTKILQHFLQSNFSMFIFKVSILFSC